MSHDDERVEQIRNQLHMQAGSVTTSPGVEQQSSAVRGRSSVDNY